MLTKVFCSILAATAGLVSASPLVKRASLQKVSNFGSNPTNVNMYIYVPAKLAAKPAVIVAIHHCDGTGPGYAQETTYDSLADQYGFIVIYPSTPGDQTECWDVSSQATLTHNGNGQSNSIANMVSYAITTYNADASHVFVTGSSSGAMMTNVMAATYPELFKAASAYSGVAAGCFMSSSNQATAWNSTCAQGKVIASSAYWKTVADNMYPGYSGQRPRFRILHGSIDTTLYPQNYQEEVKQWTGVFGYDATSPQKVQDNFYKSGYTTDTWGVSAQNPLGQVQGIYAENVGHTVPVDEDQDMQWFGLGPYTANFGSTTGGSTTSASPSKATSVASSAPAPTSSTPTTTQPKTTATASAAPAPTASAPATGSQAQHWGQCGGQGWTGPTTCVSPYKCTVNNTWYSQCV